MISKTSSPGPIVIGVAGGSGAGKTSLTEGLAEWLGDRATVIHLDNYFIPPEDMPVYAGLPNWDDPRSVKDGELVADIKMAIEKGDKDGVIIVEGFLSLHYLELRQLFDVSIFLRASHEIINKRRVHDASDHYRENVIKPMYTKYVLPSARHADHIIDVSNATRGEVLVQVMALLHSAVG